MVIFICRCIIIIISIMNMIASLVVIMLISAVMIVMCSLVKKFGVFMSPRSTFIFSIFIQRISSGFFM